MLSPHLMKQSSMEDRICTADIRIVVFSLSVKLEYFSFHAEFIAGNVRKREMKRRESKIPSALATIAAEAIRQNGSA